MVQPLVSIICSCYNQSDFVIRSLESIKKQTYQNFEIIIWDDFSNDNSVELIEKWIEDNRNFNIEFIKHTQNLGICKSLNECYRLANGKYIQLLALDDILLPWKLEKHVSILEKSHENQVLVFTDAYLINDTDHIYQNRFISYHYKYLDLNSGNFFSRLIDQNFVPAMSALIKKSGIDKVGPWDESLSYEDHDMWLRLAKEYDFIYEIEPSVKYRIHANNTHKKLSSKMILSAFKVLLKYSEDPIIKERLKQSLIQRFYNRELLGEEILYFNKFPPKNILDWIVMKKGSVNIHKLLSKII